MTVHRASRLAVHGCVLGVLMGMAATLAFLQHKTVLAMIMVAGLAVLASTYQGARGWQQDYKRVHQELLVKEERYRDFLDQANDLIQIISPEGKLLYVNRAWRETLGYTPEETANLSVFDVICPESLPHCMEAFRRIMAGENLGRVEAQFRTKDGRVIHVEGCTNCRREAGQPLNTRGIFRDITERKRAEEALRHSQEKLREALEKERIVARQDTLTKVANRRAFFEIVNVERSRACRYGHPLTLVYIDADDFKSVNDTLGHATGDELLTQVAVTLRDNVRASDTVARLGGDEFGLLFPETDAAGAEAALRNLQKRLAMVMQAGGWRVTFSMGAAVFQSCPVSVDEMLLAADKLMYTVKRDGKNNIAVSEIRLAAAAG